jgi:hypothetical protein
MIWSNKVYITIVQDELHMRKNFLSGLITSISILSIILGLAVMEICREYWQAGMRATTAGSIVLLSGALMFVGGIIALAVYYRNKGA